MKNLLGYPTIRAAKRPHEHRSSVFTSLHQPIDKCSCPRSAEAASNSVSPFDARNRPGLEVGSRMKPLNGPFQGQKLEKKKVKLNFYVKYGAPFRCIITDVNLYDLFECVESRSTAYNIIATKPVIINKSIL